MTTRDSLAYMDQMLATLPIETRNLCLKKIVRSPEIGLKSSEVLNTLVFIAFVETPSPNSTGAYKTFKFLVVRRLVYRITANFDFKNEVKLIRERKVHNGLLYVDTRCPMMSGFKFARDRLPTKCHQWKVIILLNDE